MFTLEKKMDKNKIRLDAFGFLGNYDAKIKTKFFNICSKTAQCSVPDELFQKRTSRKNRVLISWKTVKKNDLTIEQLKTFTGGVAVEFVNEDFFDTENQNNPTFIALKNKLGSDEIVSSIITIRSESGSSSSQNQREAFQQLTNNVQIMYRNQIVTINKSNYKNYAITKTNEGGIGNEKWEGFLFVSIRGGNQDTIESNFKKQTIFNPSCEFANEEVCFDLDLVMSYFALNSIDENSLTINKQYEYHKLIENIEASLKSSLYDNDLYCGNLLDYCKNHPSIKMKKGKLFDPIQVEEIHIEDFAIDDKENPKNLDFTHNQAIFFEKFYWDKAKKCILSPARPTNVFWSRHLSNMMQQNFTLDEYFKHEEERIARRKAMLQSQ